VNANSYTTKVRQRIADCIGEGVGACLTYTELQELRSLIEPENPPSECACAPHEFCDVCTPPGWKEQVGNKRELSLALMMRVLITRVRARSRSGPHATADNALADDAVKLLVKMGLQGNPLRADEPKLTNGDPLPECDRIDGTCPHPQKCEPNKACREGFVSTQWDGQPV
jgi:hypothetical protein